MMALLATERLLDLELLFLARCFRLTIYSWRNCERWPYSSPGPCSLAEVGSRTHLLLFWKACCFRALAELLTLAERPPTLCWSCCMARRPRSAWLSPARERISAGSIYEKLLTASAAGADLNSTLPVEERFSWPTIKLRARFSPLTCTMSTTSLLTAINRLLTDSGVVRQTAAIELKLSCTSFSSRIYKQHKRIKVAL